MVTVLRPSLLNQSALSHTHPQVKASRIPKRVSGRIPAERVRLQPLRAGIVPQPKLIGWPRSQTGLAGRPSQHPSTRTFPSELLPNGTDMGRWGVKRDGERRKWDSLRSWIADGHIVSHPELASQIVWLVSRFP